MSAQAVGVVVEHNPIGIIIPRHWGIGKYGSLTGYGGGLLRKEWLLKLAVPEHCLGWTFLVCPIAGLIVARIGLLIG